MADDQSSLAQAAARITDLETQLQRANATAMQAVADLTAARDRIDQFETQLARTKALQIVVDGLQARVDTLVRDLDVAQKQIAEAAPLRARNTELEALLAPPPQGNDIIKVTYDDGRVKYAAPDGSKYPIAADAQRRAKLLALMKIGLGEAQAEAVLKHSDEAIKALTSQEEHHA